MMKYGYKHYLTQDDLWNLRRRDTTKVTGNQLQEAWDLELEKKKASPAFECSKCHINNGRKPVPETHINAITVDKKK